jgi:hypothetical protein
VSSRKPEGEGGEGFYIAQMGRPADLLVIFGGGYAIDEFGDSWYGDAAVWTSQDTLNSR